MNIPESFYDTSKEEKLLQLQINKSYNAIMDKLNSINDNAIKQEIIHLLLDYEENYNNYYSVHINVLINKIIKYVKNHYYF